MKHLVLAAAGSLLAASLSAQTIANYSFDDENLITPQPPFASVTDLSISNAFQFGGSSPDKWLCLTTAWNNTGGTVSFTVTPNAGVFIDYDELSWAAVTNNPASSDSVRAATVRANGNLLAVIDPLTHLVVESVDLTAFAFLESNGDPVTFEIEFEGNPNGESSYEIGYLKLTGGPCTANCCLNQHDVLTIGTGCAPSSAVVPTMVSLSPPILGQPIRVGVNSPSSPNSLVLLNFGLDSTFSSVFNAPLPVDLGPFGFPGCSVYQSGHFIAALMLDANGRAPYQVAIPLAAKWCEAEVTFQTYALTPQGEVMLTAGLRNIIGN